MSFYRPEDRKTDEDGFPKPWRASSRKALFPFVFFVAFYFGFAFATKNFYKVPMTIAFLLSSATALCLNHQESLHRKMELFALGMGHRDIMIMCLVFICAGAFTATAKAIGGIEAAVSLAQHWIPSSFMLSGFFVMACLISLAIGTSCGTVAAMVPIAVSLSQSMGFSPSLLIGAVVGGSMFGDNLSLISDTTIAATRTQGVEMRDKMLCNLKIVILPALICVLAYALPAVSQTSHASLEQPLSIESFAKTSTYFLLLLLGIFGTNVLLLLFLGTILNTLIGLYYGTFSLVDAFSIIGKGTEEMTTTILVSLLAGGLLVLIRYNGGIAYILQVTHRWIRNRRTCELGICFLTGVMNLLTANNTIAILTSGALAKELGHRYGINPKRIASLLDTSSCIVQGMIPYGAQILIATSLSESIHLSAFEILQGCFYPPIMALGVLGSIGFTNRRR